MLAAVLLVSVSGVSKSQTAPPSGYTFTKAAPCVEDAERAAKPLRPTDAKYDVCADQMAIYTKGLADAKASGKLLLVKFGATWCPWCATLQRAMDGPELFGRKGDGLDLATTYHHVEIGLSMIHKGKKEVIPSGEAVLALILKSTPDVKIRAIPFVAVVDPVNPSRVFARNIDDVARKDGTHDLVRVRQVFIDAHAVVTGQGTAQSEPGWLKRKWLRWWYG